MTQKLSSPVPGEGPGEAPGTSAGAGMEAEEGRGGSGVSAGDILKYCSRVVGKHEGGRRLRGEG